MYKQRQSINIMVCDMCGAVSYISWDRDDPGESFIKSFVIEGWAFGKGDKHYCKQCEAAAELIGEV